MEEQQNVSSRPATPRRRKPSPMQIFKERHLPLIILGIAAVLIVTIIAGSNRMSDKINDLLHEYNHLMIGRMGMPYRECGLYLITVTLDGKRSEIQELSHRLNILRDVSVKTTFAKGNFPLSEEKETRHE